MNSYILLSAGIGRNMKGAGCKSLLPVSKQSSLIDKQIESIFNVDKKADILIVAGFEHQRLINYLISKEYDVRIIVNHNYAITSQVDSLKLGINSCRKSSVTVIHGDILFDEDCICFPDNKKSWVTITEDAKNTSVGTVIIDNVVKNMCYGLDNKWGQIAFFPKKEFVTIKREINKIKTNKLTYEFINSLDLEINCHFKNSTEINRENI